MAQLQIGPVAGLPALQDFEVQSQDSTGNLVQDGIRDLAPVIGLLKHPLVGRAAELHVQTVQVGFHLVGVNGAAIGDDYTVIAPFVPKNVLHEVTVGVDPLVVHLVVGGHDGPWVPLLDGDFKGPEVDLPEGALADNGVGPHAVILLDVDGVVLYVGGDMGALNALGHGGAQLAGQDRVLGEKIQSFGRSMGERLILIPGRQSISMPPCLQSRANRRPISLV